MNISSETIRCIDLTSQKKRPITSRVVGTLMEGEAYYRPSIFLLDDQHLAEDSKAYFQDLQRQQACAPQDINLFQFEDATIVGQGAIILADGQLVLDSALEFINQGLVPDGILGTLDAMEIQEPTTFIDDGATILVKRPWYRNFGHYLVDLMPILPALKSAGKRIDNIVFGLVPDGQLKLIMQRCAHSYYPNAKVLFADDINPIKVRTLLYVQPVHVPPLFKHPKAIEFTREASCALFNNDPPKSKSGRRLYLSRQKSGTRHIVNNDELEDILMSEGFEIYYPEQFSFGEQIDAFQNADVIIGGKGAAFTNIIFCGPSTDALVLSSCQFVDPFFWDLAAISGVRYSEIFCRSVGTEGPATANFSVDLVKIKKFLKLI